MSVLSRAILTVLPPCVAATCCHSCEASHHFPGICKAERTHWVRGTTRNKEPHFPRTWESFIGIRRCAPQRHARDLQICSLLRSFQNKCIQN
jgi:hypothetical protein